MSILLLDASTPSPSLGPLSIDGKFFRQGGERMTIIESSDFSLFKRYLENEPIYAVVAQRKDLGFNMLRVWLLNTSVVPGGILPSQYPDFYQRLGEFAAYIGFCGLNLDITAFTQTKTLMPLLSDQQRHMDATGAALEGLEHVILSRVNEGDQHDNETADGLLRPPYGLIYSAGSNGSDSIPPDDDGAGDCTEYHIIGSEWQRKTGHNAFEWAEAFDTPCWTSESTRCPDNDRNPNHYEDAAAGAALLCAGSCFHSAAGKLSTLFTGAELTCAEAHVRGAMSVPLEFQVGQYRHRDDLEGTDCLRAYSRILPDGREYIVRIRY